MGVILGVLLGVTVVVGVAVGVAVGVPVGLGPTMGVPIAVAVAVEVAVGVAVADGLAVGVGPCTSNDPLIRPLRTLSNPGDDHFTASPHCRRPRSGVRRSGGSGPGIIDAASSFRYYGKRIAGVGSRIAEGTWLSALAIQDSSGSLSHETEASFKSSAVFSITVVA